MTNNITATTLREVVNLRDENRCQKVSLLLTVVVGLDIKRCAFP